MVFWHSEDEFKLTLQYLFSAVTISAYSHRFPGFLPGYVSTGADGHASYVNGLLEQS